MKHFSINIEDIRWARVEKCAKAIGLKNPDVIRQLIDRYIDDLTDKFKRPAKK